MYGSLLAGGAALVAFVWRYHVPGLALSDLVAPSVVLGVAIGRMGCFLNGCCYGGTSDLPWSVSFPWGSPPHDAQVERGQTSDSRLVVLRQAFRSGRHRQRRARLRAAQAGLAAGERITQINGSAESIRSKTPSCC